VIHISHKKLFTAQVFKYARGQHNVIQVAKPECSFANATQVAGLTDTPFNLTFKEPGTFYYACSVSGHCDEGMLLTVHVSGGFNPPMENHFSRNATEFPARVSKQICKLTPLRMGVQPGRILLAHCQFGPVLQECCACSSRRRPAL
jgi:hypothetical protein